MVPTPQTPESRSFDGVVCFGGEDYWYHNRGHYDMQLMREMSSHLPVLYINSIGMRIPQVSEGTVFIARVLKKILSLGRGLVRVRENFSVYSPFMLPGIRGKALTRPFISFQILRAVRKLGMKRPLVWVACPPGVDFLEPLHPVGVVYQRTDRFEEFPLVNKEVIRSYDQRLKRRADLTLFCSSSLMEEEKDQCRVHLFADHGVDFRRFAEAGETRAQEPPEFKSVRRPRVGFIGAVDAHTFDPALFNEVAARLPHRQFVLVGKDTLAKGWCPHPNVLSIDRRPYDRIADYMAACDVLIMPWNQNEWIKACNPVKLKEYLAVGRPVVTRSFDELRRYEGFVHRADDIESFVREIERALEHPDDPAVLRNRVRQETWEGKCDSVLQSLSKLGLVPEEKPDLQ